MKIIPSFSDFTVAQLRARLADRGIIPAAKARKGELIQLLGGGVQLGFDREVQQLRRTPVTVYQPWAHLPTGQQTKVASMNRQRRRHAPIIIEGRLTTTRLIPKRHRAAGTMKPVTKLELAKAKVAAHS